MSGPRADFLDGVRAVLPAIPANVPFGIIVGVGTVGVGGTVVETVALSAALFAGAAQLAVIELLGRDAPVAVAVATALLVNLRYTMYSAALAPYFRRRSARWKAAVSFFILDVTFALSVARYRAAPDVHRGWYYLGTALPLWLTWIGGIAVGALLGAGVPAGLHLDFAFPLLFLAMLFPAIEGRYTAVAAAAAAVVAVGGAGLPFNLGLIVAALVGVAAGLAFEEAADERRIDVESPADEEGAGAGTGDGAGDGGDAP